MNNPCMRESRRLVAAVESRRSAYYDHLQTVRTRGDWEGWVEFFLQGVIDVSREAALTAKAILAMREEYRSKIADTMSLPFVFRPRSVTLHACIFRFAMGLSCARLRC